MLDDGKEYLAEMRLHALASKVGMSSATEIIKTIRLDPAHTLRAKVIEAMTTNETSFYRDSHVFDMISSHILPTLLKNRTNSQVIRIWSAACSSGQEPYTLAMMLRTVFPAICESRFRITGTDLSSDMIERAKRGQYSQLEVNRGVPVTHIIRHFKRNGLDWFLNDDIRRMVDFRTMNLSRPWPPMPLQDLVLIRNVMIYFDVDTRKRILSQIARVLAPDGFLILGASETPLFTSDVFERVCMGTAAAYRLKPDRAVAH